MDASITRDLFALESSLPRFCVLSGIMANATHSITDTRHTYDQIAQLEVAAVQPAPICVGSTSTIDNNNRHQVYLVHRSVTSTF